jgi:hypothetical protein
MKSTGRNKMMKHIGHYLLAIILCFNGCSRKENSPKEPLAIATAKQEARKHWNCKTVEVSRARKTDGRWIVTMWRIPKTPGDFLIIEVEENGNVIRTLRGY